MTTAAETFMPFVARRSLAANLCEVVGCGDERRAIYPLCRRMCGKHTIQFLDAVFRGCGCGPEPCQWCARHITAGRMVIVIGERENGPKNAVDDAKMIGCLSAIPPSVTPHRVLLDFQRFRRAFSWGGSRGNLLAVGLRWDLAMNLLCSSPKSGEWSAPVARQVAASLSPVLQAVDARVVLLGVRVAIAFDGLLPNSHAVKLPHPSGANIRTWKDPTAVAAVRAAVTEIYQ